MITVSVDLLEIYFGSTAKAQWHPGYVTGQVIWGSPSGASGVVVVRFCCHPCGWDEGEARFASHAESWVREVRCVESSDPVLPGDWIWSEWVPQRSSSNYRATLLELLNAGATLELLMHRLPPSETSVVAVASPLPGQYSVDGEVRLDEDGGPYLGSPSWSMWAQDEDEWASCDMESH